MMVNSYLQLIDNEYVFGVGDCVDVQEKPPAKTAQNAVHQAHVCAENILSHIWWTQMRAYTPIDNIFYVALWKHMGICVDGADISFWADQKIIKDALEQSYVDCKKGVTCNAKRKHIYS